MNYSYYKNEESVDSYGVKCEWNFNIQECTPSICGLDQYVLTEVRESRQMVLLHVEPVYKAEYRGFTFYRFTVVENPAELLKGSILYPDKNKVFSWCHFYIERKATNKMAQTMFEIKISSLTKAVVSPLLGEIQVVTLHKILDYKNYAMPPEFYKVVKDRDPSCRYHLRVGDDYSFFKSPPLIKEVVKEVIKEVVRKQIPTHIFQIVVENAIEKKEDCPVLMIPFTKKNASCGPCGHLVCYEALVKCVQDKKACPVCREKMSVADIQKL